MTTSSTTFDLSLAASNTACCAPGAEVIDQPTAARLAPMFKALGDPIRLRLIVMIAASPDICVCDLTPAFEVSAPTISHHLKVLREAGLIDSERRGTWVHYRVQPEIFEHLTAFLRLAG